VVCANRQPACYGYHRGRNQLPAFQEGRALSGTVWSVGLSLLLLSLDGSLPSDVVCLLLSSVVCEWTNSIALVGSGWIGDDLSASVRIGERPY